MYEFSQERLVSIQKKSYELIESRTLYNLKIIIV